MLFCQLMGVLLILVGIFLVFISRNKTQDSEANKIEFEGVKLIGGPGLILIGLGVILLVFGSFISPGPVPAPDNNPVTTEKPTEKPTEGPTKNTNPSAKIENVWFENGVWENNLKGVRIHTAFNTENLKDKKCAILTYFIDDSTGNPLTDLDGDYTIGGKVAFGKEFIPESVGSLYPDVTLFIPYNQLHYIGRGTYDVDFQVTIFSFSNDEILGYSKLYTFSFTQ